MKVSVKVDKDKTVGKIKPMHCVNNLPDVSGFFDHYIAEAQIPYCRLHDSVYIHWKFVDIHAVFPDFDADEQDPASYDFAFTDYYIKRMADSGVKAFYRLGESIENYQHIKPYFIYPPEDYAKWARICEKIIAHYNYGWADGFFYGLTYWEIWNEPDNFPDIADNNMWKGNIEQYFELYETVSNHLKRVYPEIKIGGYASCGFYEILNQASASTANVSSRTEYFIECFEKFLKYITSPEHRSPLDFFSWHSYSDVKSNVKYAEYARKKLDEYGFKNTESILNEWNPGVTERGKIKDASNICANMLALKNKPVDMLMYYDARINTIYCGMFDPVGRKPFPAYYVFKVFSFLYRLENQVETEVSGEDVYAVSAYKDGAGSLLITNNTDKKASLFLEGKIDFKEVYSVSEKKLY